MGTIIILVITALPTFLIARYIYKKDKNPECPKLLTKLFLGGFLSVLITLIISLVVLPFIPFIDMSVLRAEYPNPFRLFLSVFFGNALVEEFSKWIIIMLIAYKHKSFTHKFDAIVYAIFVHLGFAFLEDLLYVFTAEAALQVSIARGLTAVPGHATFGLVMGFYLAFAKLAKVNNDKPKERLNLMLSILIPTIIHTAYNFCIFIGNVFFIILFILLVIGLYIYFFKKVKYVKSINRRFEYEYNYCPGCGNPVERCICPFCGMDNCKDDYEKEVGAVEHTESDVEEAGMSTVDDTEIIEQNLEEFRIVDPPTEKEIQKIIKLKNRKIFLIKAILLIVVIPTAIFCLTWFFRDSDFGMRDLPAFIVLGILFTTSATLYFRKAKAKRDVKMKLQRMELEGNVFATYCIGKSADGNRQDFDLLYGRNKTFHFLCYTEMFKDDHFITFYNKKHYVLTGIDDEVIVVKLGEKTKAGYDKVAYSRYVLNK